MYYFYVALFYLLLPVLLVFRYFSGLKWKYFNSRYLECLGFYKQNKTEHQYVWLHAVSVGEVEAAHVLIEYLRQNHPYRILVTTGTETGYDRVRALQGDQVDHVYLPYDTPGSVERFLKQFQPKLAIIMETEIWPVLYSKCAKHSIPLFIVNARLSERSTRGYIKLRKFLTTVFSGVTAVVVQTEVDAHRYQEIGVLVDKIKVSGNIKLDMPIGKSIKPQAVQIKQDLFPDRLVFVIGSTHAGEEEIFLRVYQALKKEYSNLLLILVPRKPERCPAVKDLCLKQGLDFIMRSDSQACKASDDIFLVDTLGELKQMYSAADFAFVAGSMVPVGGHNIFEPVLLGVPVLFGPYMKNVELLAKKLLSAQGAVQCLDEGGIIQTIIQLTENPKKKQDLIINGRTFIEKNNGAVGRTMAIISPFIPT